MNKTYSIKPADINRSWYLIDAKSASLGKVSAAAASLLLGKGKPQFSSHIDCGDYVVIINAAELKVTGNKLADKKYYRHSGYPGGLHTRTLKEQLDIDPCKIITHAVHGMLPANKLLAGRMNRLKVYSGNEHNHSAQQPSEYKIGKNS